MKDNFSKVSNLYSQFRPSYPKQLFDFLIPQVSSHITAWDAGTGNGQLAVELSEYFEKVFATDLSEKQINNAVKKNNIIYKVERAEQTSFADSEFDLVTVAQAIHWFDFSKFYGEVNRTLKPGGIIAVIGYGLCKADAEVNKIIDFLYTDILDPYWDKERKYVDAHYSTIPFPFNEFSAPVFSSEYMWTREQLIGFLNSWSAVQHYKDRNDNENPVDKITGDLKNCWKDTELKKISFPVFLRIGKK
jgi:ubiquinone/menaquinone biosynthesis C-methylase UbiE